MAADNIIHLTVDASKPGAKIDRNLFGQFAENLGHGLYEGIWVGPDSSDSEHARNPQRCGGRTERTEGAQRSLARRLLSPTSITGARESGRGTSGRLR